jgi:hypothetical protein
MKKDDKVKISPADKKRLDEIAKRYGVPEVFEIKAINPKGETASAVFKKPDRNIISASMSKESFDPLGAKEVVLRSSFLEGDKRLLDDDEFFLSACTRVNDMIVIFMAEIKKN